MKFALSFDDVLLKPKFFSGGSRRDIDISTQIAGLELKLPILSANMPGVTGDRMVLSLSKAGGLPVTHRMCSIEEQLLTIRSCRPHLDEKNVIGAAIGIGKDWKERALALRDHVDIFCIDVAHGAQERVFEVVKEFREEFGGFPLIIGNIAERSLVDRIYSSSLVKFAHSTAFKIGIGGGSVCSTRVQTGCGVPTLQSIFDIVNSPTADPFTFIADGGIKNSGDCMKCFGAGTQAVMLGSVLAGTESAGGRVIKGRDGLKYKIYSGNASYQGKESSDLSVEYIEGVETLVRYKGSTKKVLDQLKEGIQSGLSYCGYNNLGFFIGFGDFVQISSSGFRESIPHGTL